MKQLIFRKIEVCARCGAWDPFRARGTRFTNGVKRVYLACRKCGARALAVYTKPEKDRTQ